MPNIRIKDITTGASAPASDDYFVLDGATNNVRKLPASFYTSQLAARAPRSWLNLKGSLGYAPLPAAGKVAFSDFFLVQPIADLGGIADGSRIGALANVYVNGDTGNYLLFFSRVGNDLRVRFDGGGSSDRLERFYTNFFTLYSGPGDLIATRNVAANTFTMWWGAIPLASISAGDVLTGSKTWAGEVADDYLLTGGHLVVGTTGVFGTPILGNRVWSQTDVGYYALTGNLPPRDRLAGSAAALLTGDNSTFDSDTGYWTKLGAATIGSGQVTGIGGGAANAILRDSFFSAGIVYRVTLAGTISSGWRLGWAAFREAYTGSLSSDITFQNNGDGSHTAVFAMSPTASSSTQRRLGIYNGGGSPGTYTIDTLTVEQVGTICHFDVGPDQRAIGRYNGIDMILGSGVTPLPTDFTRGTVRGRRTTTGFANDGNRLIASGRVINELWLYSASGGTVTIGDASGTPANVVASVSLTAGLWTRATLLKSQPVGGLVYIALGTATDCQFVGETRDGTTLV